MKVQKIVLIATVSAVLGLPTLPVGAEGALNIRSFGANRRAVSTPSYVLVQGNFQVTDFNLPQVDGVYTSPEVRIPGDPLARVRRVNSKPTFYLGAQGSGFPAEAGLQFEWEDAEISWGSPAFTHPAGWIAFMRWHDSTGNRWQQAWEAKNGAYVSWRDSTELIESSLKFQVHQQGSLSLEVGAMGENGTTMWSNPLTPQQWTDAGNPDPTGIYPADRADADAVFSPDELDSLRVRRVIGITQGNEGGEGFHGYSDGSRFACTYSTGRIGRYNASSPDNPILQYWSWSSNASYNRVNQNETGFDVAEPIPGTPPAGQPTYKIDFPNVNNPAVARNNIVTSYQLTENNTSRYMEETVRITLTNYPQATGNTRPRNTP